MGSRVLRIALGILFAAWSYHAMAGTLIKQEVEGNTRICYYQDGPDITVKTVPASDPCPASI